MAADLFETYVVTALAAMLLAFLIEQVPGASRLATVFPNAVLFPLLVCAWAIVATIVGTFFVRMRPGGTIMGALYQGLGATTAVGLGLASTPWTSTSWEGIWGFFVATAVGLIVMILIVVVTDYYTSAKYKPVHKIAEASQAGAGPTVISGFSVGLESAWMPALILVGGTLIAYAAAGCTTVHPQRLARTATSVSTESVSLRRACSRSRG